MPRILLLVALLALPACKSMEHHDHHASAATPSGSDAAIYCDKCQTTFTRVPMTHGNPREPYGVVAYRNVAKHECEECRNVATSMLQEGKTTKPGDVAHKCKICGGSMTVCHVN